MENSIFPKEYPIHIVVGGSIVGGAGGSVRGNAGALGGGDGCGDPPGMTIQDSGTIGCT
jgi:hypothetical protein